MLFNPFLNLYETVFAHFISVHLFSSRLRSCISLPNTRPAENIICLLCSCVCVCVCVYSWPCPYILYIQDHECQLLNMEYCSKEVVLYWKCWNVWIAWASQVLLQVRRSVIAFLHIGNTHTNTHSHRPLCSSSRQSCWETASGWLALSQSQALLVFHTQVEKKSYPKPATATVYPRKKPLQDIFLFLLQHSYPSNPHPRAFTCLDLKCSLSEGYLWPLLLLALTCVSYPDSVWIFLAGWLAGISDVTNNDSFIASYIGFLLYLQN